MRGTWKINLYTYSVMQVKIYIHVKRIREKIINYMVNKSRGVKRKHLIGKSYRIKTLLQKAGNLKRKY